MTPAKAKARRITDVLHEVRGGAFADDVSNTLQDVVNACRSTGKKGSITVTLTVLPDKSDVDAFVIEPDIKAKMPRRTIGNAIFFADEAGNLVRVDPLQKDMEFETIEGGRASRAARE